MRTRVPLIPRKKNVIPSLNDEIQKLKTADKDDEHTHTSREEEPVQEVFLLQKKRSMLRLNLDLIAPEHKSLMVALGLLMMDRMALDDHSILTT